MKALVSPNSPQFIQKVEGYKDSFKSPELALHNAINFIENGANYSEIDLEKEGYLEKIVHPKLKSAKEENLDGEEQN